MYQTLAGDGFSTPIKTIRAVVDQKGTALQSYPFTVKQTLDPAATYIVNTMLQGVMHEGTGKSAYSYFPENYGLIGKQAPLTMPKTVGLPAILAITYL